LLLPGVRCLSDCGIDNAIRQQQSAATGVAVSSVGIVQAFAVGG
jgi:hypothetical protein